MNVASRRMPADDPDDSAVAPATKRKKVRRGTRSCWECKRRKMKCVFERADDAICIGCHRRWTKCVSQEFPEEVTAPLDSNGQLKERLRRVEARLDHLLTHDAAPDTGLRTPASSGYKEACLDTPSLGPSPQVTPDVGSHCPLPVAAARPAAGRYNELSRTLWEALPSQEDIHKITKATGCYSFPFHEALTTPPAMLERVGLRPPHCLLDIPEQSAHPVLIARHMLYLASFLRYLDPNLREEAIALSEAPQAMRERLVELTSSLVTNRDDFVGCAEFLECVMLESLYQANCGFLRRSWIIARRAMVIAQTMGLHRPGRRVQCQTLAPDTKIDPYFMWFRIVFYDRQMCLILGLPQGTLDRNMADEATLADELPGGRLERLHCVIASRILERNDMNPRNWDYTLTQTLDLDLRRAAQIPPSRWWLMPDFSGQKDPEAMFWEMRRLSEQMCHYNLLNQVHLPYMLHDPDGDRHEYSKIVCVNASREVLSRFIMLRRWSRVVFSCRTIDFTSLMAAITLLLAHLAGRRSPGTDNFLAAQYPGDRAMIEQTQDDMAELDRVNGDPLSARSAALLRRLLVIDAQAAEGDLRSAQGVSVEVPETEVVAGDESTHSDKRVYIPYFGIIKAAVEAQSDLKHPIERNSAPSKDKGQEPAEITRAPAGGETLPHLVDSEFTFSSVWPTGVHENYTLGPLLSDILSLESFENTSGGLQESLFQDADLNFWTTQ